MSIGTPPDLAAPGSSAWRSTNWEMISWIFMRASAIFLIVLVLGHLFIMNILDGGVHRINFAFVAGRWTSPFWQVWDRVGYNFVSTAVRVSLLDSKAARMPAPPAPTMTTSY